MKKKMKTMTTHDKINIQVSTEIQNWLTQLKLIEAESYDSVLKRIKEKKVII